MIKEYIIVTGVFRKEGRRWLAECPELGTATFGRSVTQAEERLKEAILLQVNTLADLGEVDSFFREHGIESHAEVPAGGTVTLQAPIETDTFVRPVQALLPTQDPVLAG